ncbi:MAG: fibronectin type III domain-containing protein [Bacteroidales bacterium]|nr:fibronectin type III domain-containing protein [Bacteroidales bacterium]
MNRICRFLSCTLAGAALLSCVQQIDVPQADKRPDRPEGPVMIDGKFNVTRTAISGANINWIDNAKAVLSDCVQEEVLIYTAEASKGLTTTFTGEVSRKADLFYLAYPAENSSELKDGEVTILIPSEQKAGPEGECTCFPGAAFTTLPDTKMTNYGAAVTLSIPSDNIKRVTLRTIGGEAINGSVRIDIYEKTMETVPGTEENAGTIVLSAQEGCLPAGSVTLAAIPAKVSGGFVLTLEDEDGTVSETWFNSSYTLENCKTLDLGQARKPMTEEVKFEAKLVAASSSTLTFNWSPSGYSDSAADIAIPYSFALYKDAACSEQFVQFISPASLGAWSERIPAFTFTGLEPNTSYWFKAVREDFGPDDETLQTSNVVEAKTAEFTITAVPESAKVGDVILSEDFSEMLWSGDGVIGAMGHVNVPSFKSGNKLSTYPGQALGGGRDVNVVTFIPYWDESRLFGAMAPAVAQSRLRDWMEINEGSSSLVCMRPGYLKLGAEKYIGTLVTPALSCLEEGKYCDLEVSFKAARYDNDPTQICLSGVSGTENGNVLTEPAYGTSARTRLSDEAGWHEYKVTVRDVQKGERIAIGMDRTSSGTVAGATQMRMYIDEICVKLLAVNEDPSLVQPEITLVKSAYSDAVIGWNTVKAAKGYKVYVNGELKSDIQETTLHIGGLRENTSYAIKVEAYNNSGSESSEIQVTTRNVWQVKGRSEGSRMATFQWDPVDNGDLNGHARLYEMAVYSDAACENCVYSFYPYNGYSSTNTAFANSSWLGKSGNSNLKYDTRITIGSLKPATTYWFRVRSLAKTVITYHAQGSDKTMTNPYGDSDWSSPLEFTTPARHVAEADEVAYCGFDDFCVQMDFGNCCPGTTPATTTRNTYAAAVACGANHYDGKFCTYEFAIGGHQPDTWGFGSGATYIDGTTNAGSLTSAIKCNANTGDAKDWYISCFSRPCMGAVYFDSGKAYVSTPILNSPLLSEEGTDCVFSFKYIPVSNAPGTFAQRLEIRQYNSEKIYDGSNYKVIENFACERPWPEGADNSNFINKFKYVEHSVEVNVKKGECLMVVNATTGGVVRIVVDDFLLKTK